jgi:aldehyde:ferredoxin oxidoreductase
MEYISRQNRYDSILVDQVDINRKDLDLMNIEDKMKALYKYRQNQYQKLADAVYYRRGWTPNGVPTPQKMKKLGITDKKMLSMLQKRIDEDEEAGLNVWGGVYDKDESPPTDDTYYWMKW